MKKEMLGLGFKHNEKGMTLLEALVSTAIVGIGFIAIFQMVNYSVRSIDVSGERTKASFLAGMAAEDLISKNIQLHPLQTLNLWIICLQNKVKMLIKMHGEWVHVPLVLQLLEHQTIQQK